MNAELNYFCLLCDWWCHSGLGDLGGKTLILNSGF